MNYNWFTILLALILIGILIWIVVHQIRENILQDDPMLHRLKDVLLPLHPIIRHLKLYKGNKSYTINKEKVYLCLKNKNGEYYALNTIVYVTIHEIAHVLNKEDVGHTPAFHKIFDELLLKAANLGIFNADIPIPQDYCS